jgi:hypothetical protein
VPELHVLTVNAGLPVRLLEALLTRTEAVLEEQGATRIWVDPARPGTTVLAEFPEPVEPPQPEPDRAPEQRDVVGIAGSAGTAWQNGRRGS